MLGLYEETALKRVLAVMLAASAVVGCRHTETPAPAHPGLTKPQPTPVTQPTANVEPTTVPATQQAKAQPAPVTPTPAAPAKPKPIATADDGIEISRDRVTQLLMDAYGLNMVLRVTQVEMAKAEAAKKGVVVTPDDVQKERSTTLFRMGKDANQKMLDDIADAEAKKDDARAARLKAQFDKDAESILTQTLARENMTRAEFDLLMETNAYLRKILEKDLAGKITDDNVREAFYNLYGENVRVRHIELANMSEVSAAQKKLDEGVPFQQVAKEMSRNAFTRSDGGALVPFSRETQGVPDSLKQVAFTLKKPGEVSEVVEANGRYHLLQLVERIPPKAVKFEDVKDAVRQQLFDRWVTESMKLYRDQLGRKALDTIKIDDPVLAKQYQDRVNRRETELKDRDQIARELTRERARAAASTKPAGEPRAEGPKPPATRSGSDTPDPKSPATQP